MTPIPTTMNRTIVAIGWSVMMEMGSRNRESEVPRLCPRSFGRFPFAAEAVNLTIPDPCPMSGARSAKGVRDIIVGKA